MNRRDFLKGVGAGALAAMGTTRALGEDEPRERHPKVRDAFSYFAEQLRQPQTFREFIEAVHPGYKFYQHHLLLIDVLQKVADGKLKRVMIFAPPRHGKSELVSRLFPAYYLHLHGEHWVGLTSYAGDLALGLSRSARFYYNTYRPATEVLTSAARQWETGLGGGLWAAGVGGGQTGKGFHLGIVDDPVKDAKEASSVQVQSGHRDWWLSTFTTRMEEDAALVIVQTRWNERDLSGWLLEREKRGEDSEGWTVVLLPALGEPAARATVPKGCPVVTDKRAPGKPLWPQKYPAAKLRKVRRRLGGKTGYYWLALYQQRPQESAGKGRVAKQFGSHNVMPLERIKGGELVVGMDFNVDPMSLAVHQRAGDQLQLLRTVQLWDSHTAEACRYLQRQYPELAYEDAEGNLRFRITVCPDPTGKARKTSAGGQTDFTIIRKHGFSIRAPTSPWAPSDRYATFNEALRERRSNGSVPRYLVSDDGDCAAGVDSLERFVYKPGTNEPMKGGSPDYSHMYDAMSFVVMVFAPVRRLAGGAEPMWPHGDPDAADMLGL